MKKLVRICYVSLLGSIFVFASTLMAAEFKVFSFDHSIKSDTVVNIIAESTKLKFTNNFFSLSSSMTADCYSKSKSVPEKDGYTSFNKQTKILTVNLRNFHECKISVPTGSTLNIVAKNSKIKVSDSKFAVNLTIDNGDVDFKNTSSKVDIDITLGKLEIEKNKAEMNIKAQSSEVKIDDAKANLNMRMTTSDLKIDEDSETEYSYNFINKPSFTQGAFPSSSSPKAIQITIDSDATSTVKLD